MNLNQVILAGHLTRDPDLRTLADSKVVAVFSLASNRRWKGSDGTAHEEVCFIDCEAWSRTAELVGQYLTKGSACVVIGRLKQESWTDKDGAKRTKLKVVAENVQFAGGRAERSEETDHTDTVAVSPATSPRPKSQSRNVASRSGTAVLDAPPF